MKKQFKVFGFQVTITRVSDVEFVPEPRKSLTESDLDNMNIRVVYLSPNCHSETSKESNIVQRSKRGPKGPWSKTCSWCGKRYHKKGIAIHKARYQERPEILS